MRYRLLGLACALMMVLAAGAATASSTHAPARKLGDVDISLFCAPGSAWYPVKGGACLTCGGNKKPTAGVCPGMQGARKAKAVYSHRRRGPICRPGTFRKPKTRECWTCPSGFVRVPGVKFNRNGICFSPPHPVVRPARVVSKISLHDLLDPDRLSAEVKDLGCKGYGADAVFSPAGGGTCWRCPASHPQRTLYPIGSDRACGTASCGGNGERPCNFLAGEGAPCDKGLHHDLFKGQCVPKKNIACKPLVAAVRGASTAIDKANALGERLVGDAKKKIPGLGVLMKLVDGPVEKMQEQMAGMVGKLPLDKVLGQMDGMFRTPEEARQFRDLIVALDESAGEIKALMMDPDVLCGDGSQLTELIARRINESYRGELDRSIWDALQGFSPVGQARAATSVRVYAPALRGRSIAVSSGFQVFLKKGGVQLPVGFALEYVMGIANDGEVQVSANIVVGIDNPWKSAVGEFGSTGMFFSYLPRTNPSCSVKVPTAVQVEMLNIAGVSANKCGLVSVSAKIGSGTISEVAEFVTSTEPRRLLARLPEMKSSVRPGGDSLEGPSVKPSVSIGLNTAFGLVLMGGSDDAVSALAP